MQKQQRSPRFPFIPLTEAVDLLRKVKAFSNDDDAPLKRPALLKALDYGSFHGAAVKTIGALRAYDLLEKKGDGVVISEVGKQILAAESDEARVEYFQKAALSPMAFRMMWRRARHCSRPELKDLLLERGFTEPGAKRAAKIYKENDELAQLRDLEVEPDLPERGPRKGLQGGGKVPPKKKQANRGMPNDKLILPLSTGSAIIPKGITAKEFKTLMETLRTWREQLVSSD